MEVLMKHDDEKSIKLLFRGLSRQKKPLVYLMWNKNRIDCEFVFFDQRGKNVGIELIDRNELKPPLDRILTACFFNTGLLYTFSTSVRMLESTVYGIDIPTVLFSYYEFFIWLIRQKKTHVQKAHISFLWSEKMFLFW